MISKEIHQFGTIKRESSFVTNTSLVLYCETFVHSVRWTSSDWLLASLPLGWDSTRIIDRETEYFPQKVRETIHIRRQRPEMNRDGGLALPHIYDGVLIAAPHSGRDANSQSEELHWTVWTKVSQYRTKLVFVTNELSRFVKAMIISRFLLLKSFFLSTPNYIATYFSAPNRGSLLIHVGRK